MIRRPELYSSFLYRFRTKFQFRHQTHFIKISKSADSCSPGFIIFNPPSCWEGVSHRVCLLYLVTVYKRYLLHWSRVVHIKPQSKVWLTSSHDNAILLRLLCQEDTASYQVSYIILSQEPLAQTNNVYSCSSWFQKWI